MRLVSVAPTATLAFGPLAAPAAETQPAGKVTRIGLLFTATASARALGLTIRPSVLLRADAVIE
jgi:hypothetical protein